MRDSDAHQNGDLPHAGSFAERVRLARLQRHLTQDELARLIGTSTSYVSRLEAGLIAHPRASTLARFRKTLELDQPKPLPAADPDVLF